MDRFIDSFIHSWIDEYLKKNYNEYEMVFFSVAVQNDFVRLSQSLQVELEKIRQEETEVILFQSLQVELEKIRQEETEVILSQSLQEIEKIRQEETELILETKFTRNRASKLSFAYKLNFFYPSQLS